MAFDNNDKYADLLEQSSVDEKKEIQSNVETTNNSSFEKTKKYQFTLQPSVREKIIKLANESGYRSASAYINNHFKNL